MNRTRGGLGTFDAGSGLLQQASVLFQNIVNAIDANFPANEQQQRISVSLAASVLRLEIRRHKARGGGALSDPLNGSGCAGGEMRDWFDAHSTFDPVTARGCTAARRASTSFGEQLWLSISHPPARDWATDWMEARSQK